MVKKALVKVTTTGTNGTATGSADTDVVVQGKIVRIAVNYHSSAPNTTDILIYEKYEQVQQYIVNLANQNTDLNLYPQHVLEQNDGTDLVYAASGEKVYDYFHVADLLTVALAGCNALTNAVIVEIYYEETI